MKSIIPTRIAEIVFGLIIAFFGINHFMHPEMLVGAVPDYMPGGGKIWVYITGAALILAALSIITGVMKMPGSYLLAIMLFIFIIMLHLRGIMNATDQGAKMMGLGNLLKDLGLAMAAIIIGNNGRRKIA